MQRITQRVYQPINRLLAIVSKENTKIEKMDEIYFLTSSIITSRERKNGYFRNRVQELLFSDGRVIVAELKELDSDAWIFKKDIVYHLVQFDSDFELDRNIELGFSSRLSDSFFEIFKFNSEKIILLLGSLGNENIQEKIQGLQKELILDFNISLTVTVSVAFSSLYEIKTNYSILENLSKYRYLFGKGAFITREKCEANESNKNYLIAESYYEVLEKAIISIDSEKISSLMLEIFDYIATLNYINISLVISNLYEFVFNISKRNFGFNLLPEEYHSVIYQELINASYINDSYNIFNMYITAILKKVQSNVGDHEKLISNKVINYIYENYQDYSLNIDSISDSLKISKRKISLIFRQEMDISIAEYLNKYRLSKAKQLIELTDWTIEMVANNVGIENTTYFYSLFKKYYGVSPRELAAVTI
jgi:AraC-like DNA-binding protein